MESLRADNGQNEGTPRQVARVIAARSLARNGAGVCAVCKTPRVVAVPGTSKTAVRTRQNSDSDKGTDKEQVEKYPDPPQYSTCRYGSAKSVCALQYFEGLQITSRVGGLLDAGKQYSD
jgi:tRNA/tmRNA/rRNA uracil-C5-methylase (TrmA/RlmC/RlmD family)